MTAATQGADPTREEIRTAVEDVLEHPDFAVGDAEGSWIDQLFGDTDLSGDVGVEMFSGLARLASVLSIVGGIVLVAAVIGSMALRWRNRYRPDTSEGDSMGRERSVAEMLELAREAREQGDLRDALRWAFGALVIGWARNGDLEWKPSFTHRELIERGQPQGDVRARLEELVVGVDARVFGDEPTTEADLDRVLELCGGLRSGPRVLGGRG